MSKECPSYINCMHKDHLLGLVARRVKYVLKAYLEGSKNNLLPSSEISVDELRKDIHIIVAQMFNEPIQENSQ